MLGQALPCSVTVAGQDCPIDTDWRIGVQMESLLLDESVEEEQKSLLVLNLYFPDFPQRPGFYLSNLEGALDTKGASRARRRDKTPNGCTTSTRTKDC